MEKFRNTYTLPVWLTMATVFLLTAIMWWALANWRHNSRTFQPLSNCLYNAWAVAMGVSAMNTPNTWKFSYLFFIYVWYCFAMSTVFQAFFSLISSNRDMGRNLRLLMICYIPTCFMDTVTLGKWLRRARPMRNTGLSLPHGVRIAMILWNARDGLRITINCVL